MRKQCYIKIVLLSCTKIRKLRNQMQQNASILAHLWYCFVCVYIHLLLHISHYQKIGDKVLDLLRRETMDMLVFKAQALKSAIDIATNYKFLTSYLHTTIRPMLLGSICNNLWNWNASNSLLFGWLLPFIILNNCAETGGWCYSKEGRDRAFGTSSLQFSCRSKG